MIKPVIPSSRSGHSVQFYEDDSYLCGEVARFMGEALEQGEAAVVIATERHAAGIAAALRAAGHDLEKARATGQLLQLDAERTLEGLMHGSLQHGLPNRTAFRREIGSLVERLCADPRFRGVRAYGEMVELLVERGNLAATEQLESLWNALGRSHRFRLLCGYSMGYFRSAESSDAFGRICGHHTHVLPSESYDARSSGDDQLRRIAELQQRAGALEAEVADRRKLELALLRERERLQDANRRKDEFIALLSHELRNPLAPILTSLDLMDLRGDAASRREREIIRRQARHLATLVEDLLDVSRVASGKVSLEKQVVEFASIADAALDMTGPLFEERRHLLELTVPATGLLLEADPVRLPQVVANLLSNAAKYTPIGGQVSLSARRQGAEIVVVVEDNGVGIPRERLGEVFAPFTQTSQALDRSLGGLGLGLTLARSLTLLHGGTIAAESEGAGKGSRFTLRLPAARAQAPARHAPRSHAIQGTEDAGCAGPVDVSIEDGVGQRVLIADDNRDGTSSMARLVGRLGFEVRTAHDGAQALRIAEEFGPDVALVDIGLPNMDGYALATRLRRSANGSRMRLIAVTGYGQATDRARAMLAGFDAHVVKPVGLEMLRSLLLRIPEVKSG
jgi:signal transduction histidine kinase/ActR/RegA family two-component response regulator